MKKYRVCVVLSNCGNHHHHMHDISRTFNENPICTSFCLSKSCCVLARNVTFWFLALYIHIFRIANVFYRIHVNCTLCQYYPHLYFKFPSHVLILVWYWQFPKPLIQKHIFLCMHTHTQMHTIQKKRNYTWFFFLIFRSKI